MSHRASSSSSGGAFGLAIITFLAFIVCNITLGAWALQYVVAYWTVYFAHAAKHVPFLPAAVGGLFLGEITIPAAICTWILSFIL